jgi:hypothetical protein
VAAVKNLNAEELEAKRREHTKPVDFLPWGKHPMLFDWPTAIQLLGYANPFAWLYAMSEILVKRFANNLVSNRESFANAYEELGAAKATGKWRAKIPYLQDAYWHRVKAAEAKVSALVWDERRLVDEYERAVKKNYEGARSFYELTKHYCALKAEFESYQESTKIYRVSHPEHKRCANRDFLVADLENEVIKLHELLDYYQLGDMQLE